MTDLRPALTISHDPASLVPPRKIHFRHPAYQNSNLLLSFLGSDGPQGGGLHHETARLACAIVAANRWDGYLSTSRTGPPIQLKRDGLLLGQNYFFIVPNTQQDVPSNSTSQDNHPQLSSDPYLYPIVPCFREWRFPHDGLPTLWATLPVDTGDPVRSTSDAVKIRDASCRITEHVEECDGAHLCPQSEDDWFRDNEMYQYRRQQRRTGDSAIHDISNVLLLRVDVHRAFDKQQFVFLPKLDGLLSVHVLGESKEIRSLYHNRKLHQTSVAPEYLFARFAWAIFPLIGGFLQARFRRLLSLAVSEGPCWMDGEDCARFGASTGRPRSASPRKSASPKKRTRFQSEPNQCEDMQVDHIPSSAKRRRIRAKLQGQVVIEENTGDDISASTVGDLKQAQAVIYQQREGKATDEDEESTGRGSRSEGDSVLCRNIVNEGHCASYQSTSVPPLDNSQITASTEEAEVDMAKLADRMLREERARSDPQGQWEKEQQWLESIWNNDGALDATEIPRYMAAMGQEIVSSPDSGGIEEVS